MSNPSVESLPSHAVIILASGLSQRLGQQKQLLTYQGDSLLERMTQVALANKTKQVVLVIPNSQSDTAKEHGFEHNIKQLATILEQQFQAVNCVINTAPNLGMSHSLQLGIEKLKSQVTQGLDIQRVIIMGVDQVLLDEAHLYELLACSYKQKYANDGFNPVVASGYSKRYQDSKSTSQGLSVLDNKQRIIGLPINIDYQLLIKWQSKLSGDKGLRHLIRGLPNDELKVINNIKLSLDIDTPEQLEFAQRNGWLD